MTISDHEEGEFIVATIDGEDWILPKSQFEKEVEENRIIPITDHRGNLTYTRLKRGRRKRKTS